MLKVTGALLSALGGLLLDPLGQLGGRETRPPPGGVGFYELLRRCQPEAPVAGVVGATESVAAAVSAANPWVRYLDGVGHGYTLIDVTPHRVQADYYLTPVPTTSQPDPRVDPDVEPRYARSWQTIRSSHAVSPAAGPVGARSDWPEEPP